MEKNWGNKKIIDYIQTWPSDVKKLKTDRRAKTQNSKQIWQAKKLSTWLLSSGQDLGEKFFDSKHVLNPIPTSQGRNQPLYERHVAKSGRNRVKNKEMVFGNGVKNIQAAAYNGARTVGNYPGF